jgi:hydrogenase-1 operon protein HyaF
MDTRIPINIGVGPGSQPGEEDGAQLQYPEMPKGISTYQAPELPPMEGHEGALVALEWLQGALEEIQRTGAPGMADLSALDDTERDIVNQVLAEGEVSVRLHAKPGARSQESVLTGVWRTFYLDDEGRPIRDLLEVGPFPHYVAAEAVEREDLDSLEFGRPPEGVLNALPLLTELRERSAAYRSGDELHVMNLTLLPMSEEDVSWLDESLGLGPVDALSRSYGQCHVQSTRLPNVWWVRYFNSMQKLILNTIEITETPEVLCAAPEDLADSAARLADLLEPYREDAGRA